jgi:hypothetical protein
MKVFIVFENVKKNSSHTVSNDSGDTLNYFCVSLINNVSKSIKWKKLKKISIAT